MSFNVTTSASTSVSTLTAVDSPDEQSESFDSYATENSLSLTLGEDDSDVAMLLGGEATAIGENTLAYADIDVAVDATGPATSAYGSATFIAAAESPDSSAFATASSFGSLTGTDFLLVTTSSTQIVHQEADESLAIAISETMLYGVDFGSGTTGGSEGGDPLLDLPIDGEMPETGDPAAIDAGADDAEAADPETCDIDPLHGFLIDIDGNLAVLDVDAEVLGENTFLQVEAGVLTLEDTLSTITTEVIAAAG